MKKLIDLTFLFTVVAALELFYMIAGLMPPSLVRPLTGWVLNADGQWITKLVALALGSQAAIAWTLRKTPHLGVAKALAFYQMASATADWTMWLVLADDGVFSNTQAQVGVVLAVVSHYALGLLLIAGIHTASRASRAAGAT